MFGTGDLREHIVREGRLAIGRDANLEHEKSWQRRREAERSEGSQCSTFRFEPSRGENVTEAEPPIAMGASEQAAAIAEDAELAAREAETSQMVQAAARAAARRAAIRLQCCWRRCVSQRRRETLAEQLWWRQTGMSLQRRIAARGGAQAVIPWTGAVGWEEVGWRSQLERRGRLSRAAEARSLARWWLAEQRAVSVVDGTLAMEVAREAERRKRAAERLQRCWRKHAEAAAKAAREERERSAAARRRATRAGRKAKAKARATMEGARGTEAEEAERGGSMAASEAEGLRCQMRVLEQARDAAEALAAEAREAAARALEERAEMETAWASAAASLVEQACVPWAAELDRDSDVQCHAARELVEAEAQTVAAEMPVALTAGRMERMGAGTSVAPRRTGGRQVNKARIRRQAEAGGMDVMDWMRIREHQRQLAEAVGGGDAWPAILEQRLEAARSRWASLQEASFYGGDAVRGFLRTQHARGLTLSPEEAG